MSATIPFALALVIIAAFAWHVATAWVAAQSARLIKHRDLESLRAQVVAEGAERKKLELAQEDLLERMRKIVARLPEVGVRR